MQRYDPVSSTQTIRLAQLYEIYSRKHVNGKFRDNNYRLKTDKHICLNLFA